MTVLSLLLIAALPQTSTTVVGVRATVSQTCVVSTTRVTCRGAQDRPGQVRITRVSPDRPQQGSTARTAREQSGQARILHGGPMTVVEF